MPNPKGSPLLGSFLTDLWLPAIRPTLRNSTHTAYSSHVRNHLEPHLGDQVMRKLQPQRLNVLYAELLAGGNMKSAVGLAPETVIRVHATLHRALRDAVRWGYLRENPADRADPPKQKMGSQKMRTWSAEELRRFLEAASEDRDHILWLLYAMTGMRRGEGLGLRWQDVDLVGGVIAVRQTVIDVGGRVEFSTPKTARGRRVIALDPSTLKTVRNHWARNKRPADSLVFCRSDGLPLKPGQVTRRFSAILAKAGLPRIRLHDLRHTHATLALQLGIHPKIVSERLGHSTIAFTLDVYSHATPHMQSDAAVRLGELMSARNG
jgi:integrase